MPLKLNFLIVSILLIQAALAGCSQEVAPRPTRLPAAQEQGPAEVSGALVIFAAASLTEVFTELGQIFEAEYPEVEVILNFAGSQQLARQLSQGAPADVFASANTRQMDVAVQAGRVADDQIQIFAHNRLVVIYPTENPAGIERLQDLARPDLVLILAAPEAPVGNYSITFLNKAGRAGTFGPDYKDRVLGNVSSYEATVKAVFTKVALGEGDAGIVYSSDISGENADRVGRLAIPDHLNTVATYPIAPVSDTANPTAARIFIDFVLSPAGQAVLAGYGFGALEH